MSASAVGARPRRAVLVILRGLPGSGKTTYARGWVAEDPGRRARVNMDGLRAMNNPESVHAMGDPGERCVRTMRGGAIRELLRSSIDVICDDTNLPDTAVIHLADLARRAGAAVQVIDMRYVPLDTCLARNAARPPGERVPEQWIREMHAEHVQPAYAG